MEHDTQYRLHAYVCAKNCVHYQDAMGTVTFKWIYQNRPDNCRYAVADYYAVDKHKPIVVVWDMHNVTLRMPTLEPLPPPPISKHEDVDAAIMATALRYDEDGK